MNKSMKYCDACNNLLLTVCSSRAHTSLRCEIIHYFYCFENRFLYAAATAPVTTTPNDEFLPFNFFFSPETFENLYVFF